MSDYTFGNDFSAKDALARGNASKKILGSEMDTEFEAIETAVATKMDQGSYSGATAGPQQGKYTLLSADTTNATTTMADVLSNGFTLDASSWYRLEAFMYVWQASGTDDIKLDITNTGTPQVAQFQWTVTRDTNSLAFIDVATTGTTNITGSGQSVTTDIVAPVAAQDEKIYVRVSGVFQTAAATPGVIKIRFAVATGGSGTATMGAGSWYRVDNLTTGEAFVA